MSKASERGVDLRIAVRFEHRRGGYDSADGSHFAHLHAEPVVLARGQYGDRQLSAWNVDSYEIGVIPESVRALKNFRVSGQTGNDSPGHFYGYELAYSPHEVTLRDAERIVTVLRRLDRRLRDLNGQFGYTRDLPEYLARLAAVMLPRKTMNPFVRRLNEGEDDYEGSGHRSMDVDALRWWLEDQVKAWCGYLGIPQPAAGG